MSINNNMIPERRKSDMNICCRRAKCAHVRIEPENLIITNKLNDLFSDN